MAFDVLSFVMGQKAAGGSSGGGATLQSYIGTATVTGTWNETVSVDFGFLPDMLIIAPEYANYTSDVTPGTSNFMFIGLRNEVAQKFGSYTVFTNRYYYMAGASSSNSGKVLSNNFSGIDSTDSNNAINNVSENGFTFGKTHSSGTYRITALKFT